MRAHGALLASTAALGLVGAVSAVNSAYDSFTHEIAAPQTANFKDRRNPLDGFRAYDGGFEPANQDYWASTAWTGSGGYIMMLICVAIIFLFSISSLINTTCRNRPMCPAPLSGGYSRLGYYAPRAVIVVACVFLIFSAVGCLKGGSQLKQDVMNTNDRVQADLDALVADVQTINTLLSGDTGTLVGIPPSVLSSLSALETEVVAATDIAKTQQSNLRTYMDILKVCAILAGVVLIVTAASNLTGLIVPRTWMWSITISLVSSLIILAWFTFGTGVSVTVFLNDTCTEVLNYTVATDADNANSSIAKYVNCPSTTTVNSATNGAKSEIASAVTEANQELSDFYALANDAATAAAAAGETYVMPDIKYVCVPYQEVGNTWRNADCPGYPTEDATVYVNTFMDEFSDLRCDLDDEAACAALQPPKVASSRYDLLVQYADAAESIILEMPTLEGLLTCTAARETMDYIYREACPRITDDVEFINDSAFVAAISLMLDAAILMFFYPRFQRDAFTRSGAAKRRKEKNVAMLSAPSTTQSMKNPSKSAPSQVSKSAVSKTGGRPKSEMVKTKSVKEVEKEQRRAEKERRRMERKKGRENALD